MHHNLLCPKVYWPSMFMDTDRWLAQCKQCQITKGDYTEPKTLQGSLVANQPLEMLCIDFTKADIVKGDKENKVGPLIMKSFLISARCMALGKVLPCLTIHLVIRSANG